jgi:serine/threonine-protein kinase
VEKIGKYNIVEKIGKGGMGVVYKALDPRIGRVVAIKTLFAHRDAEPEVVRRFLQEARSAGALSHKNIITIYEMDEDAGQAYIVMEYLEGEDLRTIISKKTSMPLEQKLRVLIEVCEGIAHAHDMGVVHRDIKPANIFITRSGQIKILDFGLARASSGDQTLTAVVMGTPSYMSPEQVRGDKLDHRSDIFSFGVVAYELLTNTRPFHAESDIATIFKIAHNDPDPMDAIVPNLPIEISSVIAGALEKDPSKRYQHADDLLRELEGVKGILEERKRVLRDEVRAEFGKLDELVQANKSLVEDVAEKLEGMKEAAPEFFESAFTTQTGDLTPKRRSIQFDYFTLIEFRERARLETERFTALLEKRQKAKYLLLEVEALQKSGHLEGALKLLDYILRDDPTYAAAVALKKEISGRADEHRRTSLAAELFTEAQSRFAAGEHFHCRECLGELLEMQPDHVGAQALRDANQEKLREQKRLEQQRERAEGALAEARKAKSSGNLPLARRELERALQEWPAVAGAGDFQAQIDAAEREAQARAERDLQVRALIAEADTLAQAGKEDEALARISRLLDLEPGFGTALRLKAAIEDRQAKYRRASDLVRQATAEFSGGDLGRLRSLLLQALELHPAHEEARNLLEQVGRKLQDQEQAAKQRRQGMEALDRARKSLAVGRLAEARGALEAALEAFPEIPGASDLSRAIDQAEALENLQREQQQRFQDLLAQARAAKQAGAYEEAGTLAAQALELQPGSQQAANLKREIEDSRRAAESAAQKRRDRIVSVLRRACEIADRGDFGQAIQLARTVEAEPEAAAETGDLIAVWQAELKRRSEIAEQNRIKIGQLLDSSRRLIAAQAFLEARKSLKAVLELQVDQPEALDLLRRVQERIDAEKTQQAREEEGRQLKQAGLRLLSERKFRDSLAALRRAAELLGTDSSLRLAIQEAEAGIQEEEVRTVIQSSLVDARRLFSVESFDSAHAAALKVLKLAPDQAEALDLLRRIEHALEQQRIRSRIAQMLAQARESLGRQDFQAVSRLVSEILLLDGANREAKDLLNRADEVQQEKTRRSELATLLARSSEALAAGDFQQAATRAREALLLNAQNQEAQKLLKRIDEVQENRHRHERITGLMLRCRQDRSRGDLDAAVNGIQEILTLDPANKEARNYLRDLEKETRTRGKEQERERKRQALESERTRARSADEDATLILGRRKAAAGGLPAWIRSYWTIGFACLILAGAAYLFLRPSGGAAEITILTEPEGVSILVDNRPVGTTGPGGLPLRDLPAGTVTLTGQKEGFTPLRQPITLLEGKNPDIKLKLTPVAAELRIRADQPGVRVSLDGKEIGTTAEAGKAASFQVNGGQHAIVLIKEGFENVAREINFTAGQTQVLDETLRPLVVKSGLAVLRILTNPPNATVFLDGKNVGTTADGSLILQDLKPGAAKVAVRKTGYVDREMTVKLEAGRASDQMFTLAAKGATLVLTTNAPGAEVFIDNTLRGTTDSAGNLRLEGVSAESRILKVAKPGFQERLSPLNLKPGEATSLQISLPAVAATVAASQALLSVSSAPADAEVYIDEQLRGNTPLSNIRLEPGTRKVRIRKEGYREVEKSVELRAGEARAEPFNLERMRGILLFNVQPETATAIIGNRTIDIAKSKQVELEVGTYTVDLSSPGHKPLQRTVTIVDRQTAQLQAALEVIAALTASSFRDGFRLSLDNWDHPAGWQAKDQMMRAVGAGFAILKDRIYENFQQTFQMGLGKGVKASFVVRWQDSRNYWLIQINSDKHPDKARQNTIYFAVVRDGQQTAVQAENLPFPFGKNKTETLDVFMEVSGNQLVIRGTLISGNTTSGSKQLGRFTVPAGVPLRGKVGFAIFDDEEFDLSGFIIDPKGG